MSSFGLKVDQREAQYARLVGSVLSTLRAAVSRRTEAGVSQRELSDRIDMDPSSLSRVLNGRVKNVTLKTVSDILWASEYEPDAFTADALEDISPNYCPLHLRVIECKTMADSDRFVTFGDGRRRGGLSTFADVGSSMSVIGSHRLVIHTIEVAAE